LSQVTKEQVLDALRNVMDPDLHQDIVTLGFVKEPKIDGGKLDVVINLTTPACPVKDQLKAQAEELLEALPGVEELTVEMTAEVKGSSGPPRELATGVKHFIAVSSGKGGVGKSTVTVNLAAALHKTGARVGILDCDIYGPDIPMMMGLTGAPESAGRRLIPKERHGIKTMSIGYLVEEDKPVIWRGPMVHKLIEQFLGDVEWGELDYLLVDMPPGTGDAQLSLAQIVPLSGGVLVTTPQAVSAYDVSKAVQMFKQVNVDILGVIENMAGYAISGTVQDCPDGTPIKLDTGSGEMTVTTGPGGRFEAIVHLFGVGAGERLASKYGFPMLGRLPLHPGVRVGGDGGDPIVVADPDHPVSKAFMEVAGKLAQKLAIREFSSLPILQ